MAKLFLKFEAAVLKEVPLTDAMITIGRLPDNVIQVDNLAVSGHHAKIYRDGENYVIEDNNSLNGSFVNNRRISKAVLKDGDQVLIGKHTIAFQDEQVEAKPAERTVALDAATTAAASKPMQAMEATMVMGTKAAAAMLNQKPTDATTGAVAAAPARERIGVLTVIDGKTDEPRYTLTGKLTVIGKSDMATVKLKGWFAPNVAAIISKRENKYFVAPQDKKVTVKLNGEEVAGQKEVTEGDTLEVSGVKMTFAYQD